MSRPALPFNHLPDEIAADVLDSLPRQTVHKYQVLPLGAAHGILYIATSKKLPFYIVQELSFLSGKDIVPVLIPQEQLSDALRLYFGIHAYDRSGVVYSVSPMEPENSLTPSSRFENSVVREIDRVLDYAIQNNISDIHFEPYADHFRIRIRRDGRLRVLYHLPFSKQFQYINRLKIMAKLDTTEKRRPQDGNLNHTVNSKKFDIRISSVPTDAGEKIVLRILDRSSIHLDFENLGFDGTFISNLKQALDQPYGLFIVTGPTGSGKTTTLYSALSYLNKEDINILTIEDPIEYVLDGINQSRARPDLGYTFAKALRTFLRQDPDVIMIGEIRDSETAEIAIRAALTGHIVLTTLHTNNALTAVYRLLDMGVEPFLIGSTVKLIMAQRLVRKICRGCITTDETGSAFMEKIVHSVPAVSPAIFRKGQGCPNCNYTGYSGRTAIGEMIVWNEQFTEITVHGAHLSDYKKLMADKHIPTLWEDGFKKVRAGMTSIQELKREASFSF